MTRMPVGSNGFQCRGEWSVRRPYLTTCKCYPEADGPAAFVYILLREERRHPTKYMGKYSPEGDTTTLSPVIKTRSPVKTLD